MNVWLAAIPRKKYYTTSMPAVRLSLPVTHTNKSAARFFAALLSLPPPPPSPPADPAKILTCEESHIIVTLKDGKRETFFLRSTQKRVQKKTLGKRKDCRKRKATVVAERL